MNVRHYQAARERAAFADLLDRARIVVVGSDRASYLQGLLTNDIQALRAGMGCYAAYLTPQGRMISDMYVMELGDSILIEAPASKGAELIAKFDQLIFSEDVQLGDVTTTFEQVMVLGPLAADAVAAVLPTASAAITDFASFAPHQNARVEFHGERVVVARRDDYQIPGFVAYLPQTIASDLRAALAARAVNADQDIVETLRIEAGLPRYGTDMDSETIPLEAGIEDRAISFNKGCYVGQEVIIRVLHRGHGRIARKLVGLRVDRVVPGRGAAIVAGDKTVGHVTSATWSPALDGPIALGYVQRDFVTPGTTLSIRHDGAALPASVVTLPFVQPSAGADRASEV